ncbi:MAG: hypothetical protein ACR2NP_04135 [Pirellulaceae bacterium]
MKRLIFRNFPAILDARWPKRLWILILVYESPNRYPRRQVMSSNLVSSTEPVTGVIRSQCVHCHSVFRIDRKFAGHIVDCPKCWGKMQIVPLESSVPIAGRLDQKSGKSALTTSLFSPIQITLGTFFGTPLAGGFLIGQNFQRLGNRGAALTATLLGIAIFVLELTVIVLLSQWFAVGLLQAVAAAVQLFQSAMFGAYAWDRWKAFPANEAAPPDQFRTGWLCVVITLAGMIAGDAGYLLIGMFILS